ncbi:hypothetical protein BpHYR1_043948 [Brachionus plicatilis]|uniref:Uncharacterized protein n=1 Tax=Brachionus plicatilis TaxID=10195 RepID=A0A3M7PG62_BRAPC|nr:hypothetical protein BpHYR1_043948 [Brachionus plicatilis]
MNGYTGSSGYAQYSNFAGYRYTGYSVSGLDVFVWVLLTAGSIGFPMLVLTICCIRQRIKKRSKSLINSESVPRIEKINQQSKLEMLETTTNERYNHVRFNEDSIKSKKASKSEKQKLNTVISDPTNIKDFRNFKQVSENLVTGLGTRTNEAVANNYVNPNNQSTLPSILPSIPVYTVAGSYSDGSNSSGIDNSSFRRDDSHENLYSHVQSKQNFNNGRNEYDDNQPVYMNTNFSGHMI